VLLLEMLTVRFSISQVLSFFLSFFSVVRCQPSTWKTCSRKLSSVCKQGDNFSLSKISGSKSLHWQSNKYGFLACSTVNAATVSHFFPSCSQHRIAIFDEHQGLERIMLLLYARRIEPRRSLTASRAPFTFQFPAIRCKFGQVMLSIPAML
jgi:hypothetical protein